MARAIEVPVVAKKGTLARSIEGEAATAFRNLGRSSGAVAPLGRMLGKIRADADEFTKSIEASNARVIAFGASVGVINGISNAFKELVRVTVSVEKSLTDINVVLNANQSQLTKFGDGLFKVAKNTAQSFDVVAEAATEFARQGLSIEETLKRTNDALILTRLTGLKAAESVKGLTAATNGFAKAGLSTTQIINKLAAVDVKFAVSADDLIAALSRTGAVAQEAGLSMDELIGMVTAAQQVTARGGPVIGNAFKTIFTRVQRPETLKTLRELKIAVEDTSGAALPASKVLQNLATSYDGLSRSAKDAVNQQVAGVFQINILKAAIGDLQKQNSIAARATAVSASATDQAAKKNEMLNQTIAALSTQTGLALTELAKKIGDISIAPGMRDLIGSFKALVEGTTGVLDGEGTGSDFARGLLKGIGNVLTGPGLIVIGGVFIKLFKDLTVFGMSSLKNLLGLNNAAKQQAALQQGIGTLLQTNAAYQTQMAAATGNVNKQAAITQRFLQQEITLRQQAAALTGGMAGAAFMGGFRVDKAGDVVKKKRGLRGMVPGLAPTEVPNFGFRAFNPRVTKAGGTAVGSSPFQFTSSSMLGTSENYRGTFNLNASKAALAKELPAGLADIVKNSTMSGFQMQTKMAGFSPRQQEEMIGRMRNAVSTVPGLSDRAREALITAHTGSKSLIEVNKGINRALKREDISKKERGAYDQHMGEVTEKYFNKTFGTVGTGGRQGADYAIDAIRYRRGRTDPMELKKLAGFTTGDATTIASAIKKQLVSGHNPALRNRLREEAQRQGKLEKFEQAMLERFAQEYRAYVINNPGGLRGRGAFGKESYFTGLSRDQVKKGNLANLSPEQKQHIQDEVLRYNRQVLNFAPIGDAIKREKLQVGGLLGINPSQVKTKVIQNTALRSSFNPGGFGVISPTIGQNNFADARRMHKGEDLRTANLPNFALPVPGIDPKRPPLSMTPTGYSDTIKAIITGVEDEPAKKLGTSTAKALTRPTSPMATGLSRDDILATTRMRAAEKDLLGRAAIGPGGLGNTAMNAFMAYSAGTMLDPTFSEFTGSAPGALTGGITGGFLGGKAGGAAGRAIAKRTGAMSKLTRFSRFGGIPGMVLGGLGGAMLGSSGGFMNISKMGANESVVDTLGALVKGPFSPEEGIPEALKQKGEIFRSQINEQRRASLERMTTAKERAFATARERNLVSLRDAGVLARQRGSGAFSSLELEKKATEIRRRDVRVEQARKRQEFISDAGSGLVQNMGNISFAGGGAGELMTRNLIRSNIEAGQFDVLDKFFKSAAEGKADLKDLQAGALGIERKDLRFISDNQRADLRSISHAGFFERGLVDEQGKLTKDALAETDVAKTNINKILEQDDKFKALGINVQQTAENFRELENSMKFSEDVEQLNDELRETAAAMENVNRFTSGFSSSFATAFSNITTGASSAKNAMMDFGISVFGAINKIQSERIAQSLTGALFPEGGKSQGFLKGLFGGNQKGGLIKAQNGMYISGGRTGDKNPALLEDGEYVLNRNAVKALGGPSAIDGLNFGIAPRFQSGGRLASPIASAGVKSSALNKIIEENEFLPPVAGMGSALGGGGASVRLGITDPRLSGFAHANDPILQNVRADIQNYHEKQRQKKFASQAKKDQLVQTIVGAVVSSAVAFGVDKAKGAFSKPTATQDQMDFTSGIFGFEDPVMGPARGPNTGLAPGYNMIPGASTAPPVRMLQPGQQAGMMKPMPAHARSHMNALAESRRRLLAGEKFRGAVSPMGPHGGTPGAIMDTMRKRGIKGGDRKSMGSFFQGLVDSIANKFGIIGSPNVPASAGRSGFTPSQGMIDAAGGYGHGNQAPGARMGNTNQGIINMLNRGRGLHDKFKGDATLIDAIENRKPRKIQKDKNGNVIIEYQSGGYIDNIPAMLTGGEFVVNPSTVRRHGSAFFSKLNRGGRIGYQTGGLVGDQQFVPAQGDTQNNNKTETSNNNATSNTTVNITVNTGTGEANVDGGNAGTEDREMATRLRDAVLSVLKQEKRTGGMLRDVTSNDQ